MSDPKKELTPEQLAKIAGGRHLSSSSSSSPKSFHPIPVKDPIRKRKVSDTSS
jgi:hypothetical protein